MQRRKFLKYFGIGSGVTAAIAVAPLPATAAVVANKMSRDEVSAKISAIPPVPTKSPTPGYTISSFPSPTYVTFMGENNGQERMRVNLTASQEEKALLELTANEFKFKSSKFVEIEPGCYTLIFEKGTTL
jgi:FtsP/CotA-like multicopper oxidase with cupredoxin domain